MGRNYIKLDYNMMTKRIRDKKYKTRTGANRAISKLEDLSQDERAKLKQIVDTIYGSKGSKNPPKSRVRRSPRASDYAGLENNIMKRTYSRYDNARRTVTKASFLSAAQRLELTELAKRMYLKTPTPVAKQAKPRRSAPKQMDHRILRKTDFLLAFLDKTSNLQFVEDSLLLVRGAMDTDCTLPDYAASLERRRLDILGRKPRRKAG